MNETTNSVSRRALLASGFAVAVAPAADAAVITTDTNGLIADEVAIQTKDGMAVPAYVAYPISGTNRPVVIVVQEIFGVHEHIKDVCRRFAKRGYYAIAPELFVRQGDVSKLPTSQKIGRAHV